MKRTLVLGFIVLGLLATAAAVARERSAVPGGVEKAVVQFVEPVKLLNVVLKGDYVFVHDEDKMAKGEDCTYVYAREPGKPQKLVVSFHCIPVERDPADSFTVLIGTDPESGLPMITEYRFAKSAEGHKVPPLAPKP